MERFEHRLARIAAATEQALRDLLPPVATNPIAAPMHHAVLNGGKRLRAYLAIESAALFGLDVVNTAAAIEAMHAYSLVHDDLPCMDDDDLRRGKPTVHVQWDEATAVLAGDALQTLAFEILADPLTSANASVRIKLVADLAQASGASGMVLGQVQDIAAETADTPLTLDQITELQANKTGALIEWSACSGATLAQEDAGPLAAYSAALGRAFQIQDDVLDVVGDAELAGKRLQKDADAGKATFVSILGLEAAQQQARSLVEQACDALSVYESRAEPLRQVAQFVINRNL